jgi:hypothetical protein
MHFRLQPDRPIDILPDGTVYANVLWYDDDADPEHDAPFLIDQVRLPYWFLYQDDAAREAYLLSAIANRAQELKRERERTTLLRQLSDHSFVHELSRGVHRVTSDGKVVVRRHAVSEQIIQPGVPDAPPRDTVDRTKS